MSHALAVHPVAVLTVALVNAGVRYALLAAVHCGLTDSMILGFAGEGGDGNL